MSFQSLQCIVAGFATATRLQSSAAFLVPAPQLHLHPSSPEAAPSSAALSGRTDRRSPLPLGSLISSWLPGADREEKRADEQNSIQVATQTLRAPFDSFEAPQPDASGPLYQESKQQQQQQRKSVTEEAARLAGLLCLERSIPGDVLSGLEHLAGDAAPFKVEVLRAGGGRRSGGDTRWYSSDDADGDDVDDGWLETLVNPLGSSSSSSSSSAPLDAAGQQRSNVSARKGRSQEMTPTASPTHPPAADARLDVQPADLRRQQLGVDGAQEAVRWLKEDVRRVANVFAREVLAVMAAEAASAPGEIVEGLGAEQLVKEDDSPADVTVKLELLKRGKCPRFHLDKVPIRMICTYVGPSTEWLDGYDRGEMENNRSLPPACNLKISGGREGQRANPGDVLIFKGRPEGSPARGGSGARAVAHRSPDTVEGQRRLVLTMDVGNIISEEAAATSRRRS
ncbi:unnamed protein product [Scytosiphon promiscuus]